MFERFTDRVRKIMALANQEAHEWNHEYIGTEHILLSLVKEGSGVAAKALKNLDVDPRRVRVEVEKLVLRGPDTARLGKLPQAPRAKRVIEHAIEEARRFGHSEVDSEHLLLGLLRDQDGLAAQVLMNLGVTLEAVREEVCGMLAAADASAFPSPGGVEPVARRRHETAKARPSGFADWWRQFLGRNPEAAISYAERLRDLADDAPDTAPQSPVTFERFTDRARVIVALANQEAQRFNHAYLGTEHILLGLVKEGSGVGANVLKNHDIKLRHVRMEVQKLVAAGPTTATLGKLPQTPRARRVIAYAIEESRNLQHNYVGSEHLLLGLLGVADGVAARVLANLGLTLEEAREEVLNLFGAGAGLDPLIPERETAAASPDPPAAPSISNSRHIYGLPARARRTAGELGHKQANSAHILLTLLEDDNAHATQALRDLGVDPEQLRAKLKQRAEDAEPAPPPGED